MKRKQLFLIALNQDSPFSPESHFPQSCWVPLSHVYVYKHRVNICFLCLHPSGNMKVFMTNKTALTNINYTKLSQEKSQIIWWFKSLVCKMPDKLPKSLLTAPIDYWQFLLLSVSPLHFFLYYVTLVFVLTNYSWHKEDFPEKRYPQHHYVFLGRVRFNSLVFFVNIILVENPQEEIVWIPKWIPKCNLLTWLTNLGCLVFVDSRKLYEKIFIIIYN